MTSNQIYRKFNRQAIACGLSGKQMQCWQLLYELLEAKQEQDVPLNTAMLLSLLDVSRSQFFRIRQELEQQGFLRVRVSGEKRIYYTLLLGGELVKFPSGGVVEKSACSRTICTPRGANFPTALPDKNFPASSGDGRAAGAVDNALHGLESRLALNEISNALEQRDREALPDKGFPAFSGDGRAAGAVDNTLHGLESRLALNKISCASEYGVNEALPDKYFPVFSGDGKAAAGNVVGRCDHTPPLAQRANMESAKDNALSAMQYGRNPSGDLILTNRYDQVLRNFAAAYANNLELWGALKNWAELRKKNGWTLTGWGFDVLLQKLADLGKGCAATMAAIVRRSVEKRWKGFYPLRVDSKPSGETLRKQERREEWLDVMRRKTQQVTQKFKSENRDLSMLVQ